MTPFEKHFHITITLPSCIFFMVVISLADHSQFLAVSLTKLHVHVPCCNFFLGSHLFGCLLDLSSPRLNCMHVFHSASFSEQLSPCLPTQAVISLTDLNACVLWCIFFRLVVSLAAYLNLSTLHHSTMSTILFCFGFLCSKLGMFVFMLQFEGEFESPLGPDTYLSIFSVLCSPI